MSEHDIKRQEETREVAEAISDMLNNMSFEEKEFIEAISRDHRTLQQKFTRTCIAWLKHCGSEEYQFDDRNKGSHDMGKAITEFLKTYQGGLPHI